MHPALHLTIVQTCLQALSNRATELAVDPSVDWPNARALGVHTPHPGVLDVPISRLSQDAAS
jgi:hypothetical protein